MHLLTISNFSNTYLFIVTGVPPGRRFVLLLLDSIWKHLAMYSFIVRGYNWQNNFDILWSTENLSIDSKSGCRKTSKHLRFFFPRAICVASGRPALVSNGHGQFPRNWHWISEVNFSAVLRKIMVFSRGWKMNVSVQIQVSWIYWIWQICWVSLRLSTYRNSRVCTGSCKYCEI